MKSLRDQLSPVQHKMRQEIAAQNLAKQLTRLSTAQLRRLLTDDRKAIKAVRTHIYALLQKRKHA